MTTNQLVNATTLILGALVAGVAFMRRANRRLAWEMRSAKGRLR